MSAQHELEKLEAIRAELEAESISLKEQQSNLAETVISLEEKVANEELKKEKAAIQELKNNNKAVKDAIAELEAKRKKLENKLEILTHPIEAEPKQKKARKEPEQTQEAEVAEPVEEIVEEFEAEDFGVTVTAIDGEVLVEEQEIAKESNKKGKKKRRFF
jgi:DNA repair exonuclease SbcCD ATPase subunit